MPVRTVSSGKALRTGYTDPVYSAQFYYYLIIKEIGFKKEMKMSQQGERRRDVVLQFTITMNDKRVL